MKSEMEAKENYWKKQLEKERKIYCEQINQYEQITARLELQLAQIQNYLFRRQDKMGKRASFNDSCHKEV